MTNPDDALHPLPPAADPAASACLADPAAPPLSAAQEAAAFVAKIFAEPVAEAPVQEAQPQAEAQEQAPAFAPVPQDWPAQAEPPLRGQRVLVLGLGASGLAMARWCARCGAQVTVADTRAAPPQLATLRAELPQARFIGGAFDAALVHDQALDAIYRSPGLAPAALAPVLEAASACQVSVCGELDLHSQALRALRAQHGYTPAVLAVTGTNGKTTVTSLTGQLVQHAGRSVAVAGNIGPTLLDTLAARIAAQDLPDVWVLELSSFQLDGVQGFEPTAAVVLNLTQDHLDWHGSMAAYGAAKARIFGQTGLMVLNREDPAVMQMLPEPVRVRLQKPQLRAHVTFGADRPQRPGDFGIETINGMAWL
ncbi:MAG: UDP-N-acetylmuramoyl-L-alanine--D-glutamate ligase, partial [Comamonadaceae bacterium]|nr:UDP-N-acetylmuramoyl-L-alanine--D-glutamate ligase [Comamonadaceae bacterium]